MLPLFVASAMKTSIVLSTFKHLKCLFMYCSCITCYSPRILFEKKNNYTFCSWMHSIFSITAPVICRKRSYVDVQTMKRSSTESYLSHVIWHLGEQDIVVDT
ncbi:origin recognition complex 5 subunit [Striga asiatica]|uniref:Origin recognition complex 5 subunit n=1 Tax=Striga asiatica TaxID=4170 RepID=A0A5A7Q5X2_STRAF|nr:origin recognition complex 5 subunit [Striga asiatica]